MYQPDDRKYCEQAHDQHSKKDQKLAEAVCLAEGIAAMGAPLCMRRYRLQTAVAHHGLIRLLY